ncbi:MAG: methionine adenosyltransferase domain-containing protein, partial [Malacoplasma sp.]|nr:methionine adenosyltransferase domain-containing protein [Malacoplasma sp.]
GAYYARYIAKNLVKANVADRIEIQFSYNIGSEEPVSMDINTFDTHKIALTKIYEIVNKVFKFKLKDIVEELDMKNIKYIDTAVYGHFTTLRGVKPWEKTDKVEQIKKLMK